MKTDISKLQTSIEKRIYVSPTVDLYSIQAENIICQSPGAGGSEGVEEEDLAPNFFDFDFFKFGF